MQKYLLLILLLTAIPVRAENVPAPDKFKNPIFNNTIYSENYKSSHDSEVTPTYIKDVRCKVKGGIYCNHPGADERCEYITEDDKAILLKCQYVSISNLSHYVMLVAKYKMVFSPSRTACFVWRCSFDTGNGFIDNYNSALMRSEYPNCDDEEEYDHYKHDVRCSEELKARGWDKYLNAKWREDRK